MDAHELKIAIQWAKRLEKENVDLYVGLCSHVDNLKKPIETLECLQFNVQKLSFHTPITEEHLEDLQMQIQLFIWKARELDYSFHQMAKLEVIKTKNMFMKAELLIYQQKVRKNQVEQVDFYKAQITEIMNDTFINY